MSSTESAPESSAGLDERRQAVEADLHRLLRLDDARRGDWLDRQQPPPGDAVEWYLYLFLVVDQKLADLPSEGPDWARLELWLLRQGHERGVLSDAEVAIKMAYLVAGLWRVISTASAGMPSAAEVVRACLESIPVAVDRVATVDRHRDLHALDLTQMRQSRRAKNLINAAEWFLDEIQDERLADQLGEWIMIKPRLV